MAWRSVSEARWDICLLRGQNTDHLFLAVCGIPDDKLVEAHGSFSTASCHLCYTAFPAAEAKVNWRPRSNAVSVGLGGAVMSHCLLSPSQAAIMSDKVPLCSFCTATVKPDVVFFGEDLPEKYFLHTKDFPKADLLIIMGTSLQVYLHMQRAIYTRSLSHSGEMLTCFRSSRSPAW